MGQTSGLIQKRPSHPQEPFPKRLLAHPRALPRLLRLPVAAEDAARGPAASSGAMTEPGAREWPTRVPGAQWHRGASRLQTCPICLALLHGHLDVPSRAPMCRPHDAGAWTKPTGEGGWGSYCRWQGAGVFLRGHTGSEFLDSGPGTNMAFWSLSLEKPAGTGKGRLSTGTGSGVWARGCALPRPPTP